jgi:putative transcriptional regulator
MSPAERLAAESGQPTTGDTPVRVARRRLGLTLKQVAPRVGVSIGTVSQMELGDHCPSIHTALRLARFYGMTVEDLFGHLVPDERTS